MFSLPFYYVIIFLLAGFLLTWLLMRPDQNPSGVMKILFLIRSIIVFMILLVLFRFAFRWDEQKTEPPKIALLLDATESMELMGVNNHEELIQNINNYLRESSFEVENYVFGADTLLPYDLWNGAFHFSGTDLSAALKQAFKSNEEENLQGMVVITDGQVNKGENPLFAPVHKKIPLFVIGTGDTQAIALPSIEKLEYNRLFFIDSTETLKVYLSGGETPARLILTINGKDKDSGIVPLSPEKALQISRFPLVFNKRGDYEIKLSLYSLGENKLLDQKFAHISVAPGKYKAALLTDTPDFTTRSLITIIRNMKNFSLQSLSSQISTNAVTRKALSSADFVILQGFYSDPTLISDLMKSDKPLFIIIQGMASDDFKQILKENLSLKIETDRETISTIAVPSDKIFTFLPGYLFDKTLNLLRDLPPLRITTSVQSSNRSFTSLFTLPGPRAKPILQYGVFNRKKWILFSGDNLWNWHFKTLDTESHAPLMELFRNLIKWVSQPINRKQIQIYPERRTYNRGETVTFSGIVIDKFGKSLDNLPVEIAIENARRQRTFRLKANDGIYGVSFSLQEADTLSYRIYVPGRENDFPETTGKLMVTEHSIESRNLYQNLRLLRHLAERYGGNYINYADFTPDKINFPSYSKSRIVHREILFYFNPWYMGVILILFFSELIIRKIYGFL